ncbi:MFS transporter [Paracoccus sp. 1_MG-2023]|uniref:MFS transporter n=1 Tax=unclassified Paracoccus (in: a-proteobacteria) TaxID=2688777 RepID=UPI0020913E6A|nr:MULTISPECIES: MFS transporter [unclassified Paracoccus (in: a-proteobacteria)]MDO6670276.1 MFS transporter [Paracoccus sp. 1_MG-2023]
MSPFLKLSAAGFAATASSYGPARMGFGLFLAQFKESFGISTTMAGLISGGGFAGFLLGLIGAYAATAWRGPRLPVIVGLAFATIGMIIVAMAPNAGILALGVILAMTSAGFGWSPYNNAVHQQVAEGLRPRSLSIVSTGTSLGAAMAGAVALALMLGGASWRIAWVAFAAAGLAALIGNLVAMRDVAGNPGRGRTNWRAICVMPALPLYLTALSFGITTTIYISFATDRVAQAGGLAGLPDRGSPAVMFIIYGIAGLAALGTAAIKDRTGLALLVRGLLLVSALSLALIALSPNSWIGVGAASALQGIFVMMMSAVLAFWSERLFPELPSFSFTATLLAVAVGSVVGPALAGFLSNAFSSGAMFLGAAALSGVTAIGMIPRLIREDPLDCGQDASPVPAQ